MSLKEVMSLHSRTISLWVDVGVNPCTLHHTSYTLHPTPYALHPTPYTLHPTPYTLHPTPFTEVPGMGGVALVVDQKIYRLLKCLCTEQLLISTTNMNGPSLCAGGSGYGRGRFGCRPEDTPLECRLLRCVCAEKNVDLAPRAIND